MISQGHRNIRPIIFVEYSDYWLEIHLKSTCEKERLTIAADRLVRGESSILNIALDCQFESHASFTRSFKQLFKMTPEQYREKADPFRLIYKDQFSPHMLHHLQNRLIMEPKIVTRSEVKVIGIARQYQEEDLDIETLWSAFRPSVYQITNRVGCDAFGIYEAYHESENSVGFSYICSVEVADFDDVPEGMTSRIIPEHLYAVFRHKGPISFLPETLKYIWEAGFPNQSMNMLKNRILSFMHQELSWKILTRYFSCIFLLPENHNP